MKKYLFVLAFAGLSAIGCNKKANSPTEPAVSGSEIKEKTMVEMETSVGTIVLELDAKAAPVTVKNFLSYVNDGFYDGTIFHRVIDGFMVQGGGFDASLKEKTTKAPIINEGTNGLSNGPLTVAMARTNDPNSATAQFFINLVDNKRLDAVPGRSAGYAVFGKVVEGGDIIKKIGKVATTTKGMYDDVPAETIVIKKVKVRA